VPTSWRAEVLDLSVDLQDADGAPLLTKPLSHQVKLPPNPTLSPATDFGVVRSFTFNNLLFSAEGSYSFVITVDGEPVSRLRFMVRARPSPPPAI
jgi:hypothetical protein